MLAIRRPRPGTLAIFAALAYAVLRFALDYLRLPETEPRHATLTTGQWGWIVIALIALIFLVARLRTGDQQIERREQR